MNILKTDYNGGMPFDLDDIRWMQNSYIDAFNNLLKDFAIGTNPNFIVTGCEIVGSPLLYLSKGYVYLNGELLQVDEQSLPGIFGTLVLKKVTTYDVVGTEEFKDWISHPTYQKNRGVLELITGSVPTDKCPISQRLTNKVFESITNRGSVWNTVGESGQPDFESSWSAGYGKAVQFKRDAFGRVTLRGQCVSSAPFSNSTVFVLPLEYRPSQIIYLPVLNSEVPGVTYVVIDTTGTVVVNDGLGTNTDTAAYLDSISFVI